MLKAMLYNWLFKNKIKGFTCLIEPCDHYIHFTLINKSTSKYVYELFDKDDTMNHCVVAKRFETLHSQYKRLFGDT